MVRRGIDALWFSVICLIIDDYFKSRCKNTKAIANQYFHGDLVPSLCWMCDACDLSPSWVIRRVKEFEAKSTPPYSQINLGKYVLGEWGRGCDYNRFKRTVDKTNRKRV